MMFNNYYEKRIKELSLLFCTGILVIIFICTGCNKPSQNSNQEKISSGTENTSGDSVKEKDPVVNDKLEDISPKEAHKMMSENKSNSDFVILDVRTPEEFKADHLDKSINYNFHSAAFNDSLIKLDKNKTYLVYCRVGGRSGKTVEKMKDLGFKKVYTLHGGITEWKSESLPVVK